MNNPLNYLTSSPEQAPSSNEVWERIQSIESALGLGVSSLTAELGLESGQEQQSAQVISLAQERAKRTQEVTPKVLDAASYSDEEHQAHLKRLSEEAYREAA